MKAYRIAGLYSPKGREWFKFTKDVVANDEAAAIERVYSVIGSTYGIKRRLIKISAIKNIRPVESNDPVVKYYLSGKNE